MAVNIAAAAAAAQEMDPVLKKAVRLLHSSNPSSAAELRLLLDEALKLRHGPEKMLSKNMSQRMMDDEANFPGRATPQPLAQALATDEIINLTNSPDKVPSDSPDTIVDSDDGSGAGLTISGVVNTGDTGDFGDLNCCVCGEMMFTANNRLIECSKCGALYHQDCHKPPISNEEAADDQEHIWQCDTCCNKPSTSRAATGTAVAASAPTVVIPDEPMPLASKAKSSMPSSRSSTSSNSSSPFYKPEASSSTNTTSSSSSKHAHKSSSSSSSKSHKEERSSKSVAPSLSAINAPEKHSSSSGTSSSRRSSSNAKSSSSKSKHHESSSSSKRRNK